MIYNVFDMITPVIESCANWFMQILFKISALDVWLAALGLHLVYKFILSPIFGYASSDLAHKSYNAFKRRKE